MHDCKIGIIGAGAMGGAVARGLAEAGAKPEYITVSNPSDSKLASLRELGIVTTPDNRKAAEDADLLVIAVKPWILPGVIEELKGLIDPDRTQVAVIVAGISGNDLLGMFGWSQGGCNLSLVMPNTAMTLRKSMTFIVNISGTATLAAKVFSRLGQVKEIEERLLPGAAALASCGIRASIRPCRCGRGRGTRLSCVRSAVHSRGHVRGRRGTARSARGPCRSRDRQSDHSRRADHQRTQCHGGTRLHSRCNSRSESRPLIHGSYKLFTPIPKSAHIHIKVDGKCAARFA